MLLRSMKFLILFTILLTQASSWAQGKKPFSIGVIDEFQSEILHEKRTLNIYLPQGYNPKDSLRYPVIYLLDGSADEDFIHIAGLVQFYSFEWIATVKKSIVVGIANIDRERDFTFPTTLQKDKERFSTSGHSAKFMDFIEKELQPYLEKEYKTTKENTLIGQSLGGLLATEILLKRPQLFQQYIIVSPSLWWDNGSLLKLNSTVLNQNSKEAIRVYLAVGKEGLTPTEIPRVMEVDANLLAERLSEAKNSNLTVHFDYLPLENHATILHQAVMNAFQFLSKSW